MKINHAKTTPNLTIQKINTLILSWYFILNTFPCQQTGLPAMQKILDASRRTFGLHLAVTSSALLAVTLGSCAVVTPNEEPAIGADSAALAPPTIAAEPPPLTPLETVDPGPQELPIPNTNANSGLFPGLQRAGVRADKGELPFEQSVAERRKRIDLGLEAPRQSGEPVNNVLDLEF